MLELMNQYVTSDFIESLLSLSPAVGVGLIVGIIAAIVGWVVGLVMRMSTGEV